jgi:hypothetical protein
MCPRLRYRIEEATVQTAEGPASVGRYVSLGEASITVQELLHESDEPEARIDREAATEWLRAYLTDDNLTEGRAKSADVKKAARAAGFSERILARARTSLKVHVAGHGFPGESYWHYRPITAPSTPTRQQRLLAPLAPLHWSDRDAIIGELLATTTALPEQQAESWAAGLLFTEPPDWPLE